VTSLPFDADAVRSLAVILADTGLTEIEIEGKEGRIRVVRAPAPVIAPAATVSVPQAPMVPAPGAPAPAAPVAEQDDANHPGAVLSPMVGIAYLAAEPGATAFITLGQTVAAGQTVMLIEAMKTFNQIKAPKAGTVTRILVTSGAPVEFGQPLLILE
jgi:acetyl-CoA carboxylase biotin carboxyl carrier protein